MLQRAQKTKQSFTLNKTIPGVHNNVKNSHDTTSLFMLNVSLKKKKEYCNEKLAPARTLYVGTFLQCKIFPTVFLPEASIFQNAKPTCLKSRFYTFTLNNSKEAEKLFFDICCSAATGAAISMHF